MNPTLSMGIMAILIRIPGHLVRFFLRLYNLWCIFLDYVPFVYNKHGNEYWRRLWRFRRFNIIILAIFYQNYCALMQFLFGTIPGEFFWNIMRRLYKIEHGNEYWRRLSWFRRLLYEFRPSFPELLRINTISRPFDTISGAFSWTLCVVCIK